MVDLRTTYLGLTLRSPLVASASPLSREVEGIRRLEEAGAGEWSSIPFLKSSCGRRKWSWSITSTRVRRVSPNHLPISRSQASSRPAPRDIWSTFVRRKRT